MADHKTTTNRFIFQCNFRGITFIMAFQTPFSFLANLNHSDGDIYHMSPSRRFTLEMNSNDPLYFRK